MLDNQRRNISVWYGGGSIMLWGCSRNRNNLRNISQDVTVKFKAGSFNLWDFPGEIKVLRIILIVTSISSTSCLLDIKVNFEKTSKR